MIKNIFEHHDWATKFWYYKYYAYYIALLLPIDDVSSAVYQGPPALLMPQ